MSRAALADSLARSVTGGAWHGPALLEALALFDASAAARRPIPGAHSAWELALHAAGWMREVARRLHGGDPAPPEDGDWPLPPPQPADDAWAAANDAVHAALTAVLDALAVLPEAQLERPVGPPGGHDAPLGTGLSHAEMLRGLAQHNAYHAGQLVLLHRALEP